MKKARKSRRAAGGLPEESLQAVEFLRPIDPAKADALRVAGRRIVEDEAKPYEDYLPEGWDRSDMAVRILRPQGWRTLILTLTGREADHAAPVPVDQVLRIVAKMAARAAKQRRQEQ